MLEAIEEDVPVNVIAGSLFARFASRQDDAFAMKVLRRCAASSAGTRSKRRPRSEQ